MLDIVLLILKIIGIILAVLLGLVILILLIVLFAPVKYNIRASYYDNKPLADVRVTALFHLVRFKLTYIEELKYRVKVLFFTVYSSDKKDADETEKGDSRGKKSGKRNKKNKKDKSENQTRTGRKEKDSGEKNVFDDEEIDFELVTDSDDDVRREADAEVVAEEKTSDVDEADYAASEKTARSSSGDLERTTLGSEGGTDDSAEKTAHASSDNAEEAEQSSSDSTEEPLENEKTDQAAAKQNIFKKLVGKIRELIDRIKELYESLKAKIVSIIDSIRTKKEDLSEKIDSFYEIVNDEDNRELVRFLWEQLKKLLRIIKPKKGKLYVHYGMDNPETTGKIAMYLAVLYGWLGIDINILPDFEQKIMEGELNLKGSIRLFGIIIIALKVYTNKQFKKVVLKK